MGYAITWCAVRDDSADAFLAELGLTPTHATEEHPQSKVVTGRLDTGWVVVHFARYAADAVSDARLAELSVSRDIVRVLVEEHVNASSAELWSGGKRRWWISHAGEDGGDRLDTQGRLPDGYADIRARLAKVHTEAEGEADYVFEIPLEVAKDVVGFRHDEEKSHLVGGRFTVMSGPARAGLLARLFGK
jgi:hypothetical protein